MPIPASGSGIKVDVVVDLNTTVRPGDTGYPLNAARDAFQGDARWTFRELTREVERENESVAKSADDEVFDPWDETSGDAGLAEALATSLDDPAVRRALADAAAGVVDFYNERMRDPGVAEPVASLAPAGTEPGVAEEAGPRRGMPPGVVAGAEVTRVLDDVEAPGKGGIAVVRQFLAAAGNVAVDDAHPPVVTADVARALDAIEEGDQHPVTVQTVRQAVEDAAERAMGPGGGGLLQVVAVPAVLRALDAVEAPGSRRAAPVNPFGRYAGLRVNKARYDRARARRFKRSWAKWIPHLVVWDATLRMVAGAAAIPAKFKPGFVLDDDVLALTSRTSRGGVVYLHPDRFAQVLKAHAARPAAVAVYLHHLACHELTHLDSGRLHANGHDERWVSSREDLGVATGHLLPAIVALVERTLKVKGPPSADAAFLAAARNEVEQVRRALERERGKAKAVAGELRAANRELVGLREGVPTPGTRLRWRTLAEWLVGWREIRGRRISRQTYEAQAAHLAALADNAFVVEAAPAADVDRLEGVLGEHNVTPPHGKRAGHQVTQLRDAMAVARRRAGGAPARRKVTAEELLERVVAAVVANPPAGVTGEDVRGFAQRNWAGLVGEVRGGIRRGVARLHAGDGVERRGRTSVPPDPAHSLPLGRRTTI